MCAVALAPPRLPEIAHPKGGGDRAAARELERELLVAATATRETLPRGRSSWSGPCRLPATWRWRYIYTDEPFDDLFPVASLGLIEAIDPFGLAAARSTRATQHQRFSAS